MANRIQVRRDTGSNWTDVNPVLADGELGLDIDNNQLKYGDGTSTWTQLAYQFPSGGIIMWSGAANNIPPFWRLCDGTNGTPDLRNRFIVGAGDAYAVGATGGSANAAVISHSHTASTSITDPGHNHTNDAYNRILKEDGQGTGTAFDATANGEPNIQVSATMSSASTGISATTTVDTAGDSGTNANLPPYYALCFIMKT